MAAQCMASRLHSFLHRLDEGDVVDRIRREVAGETPKDRIHLRAVDLALPERPPSIFAVGEGAGEDCIDGSYRLLEPEERTSSTPPKKEGRSDGSDHV